MADLGILERVDVREIWETEAKDFTPWLAQEENLNRLASVLGLELELEAEEQSVGPFRADILCKNTDDDTWVLIENQLERTDHPHLGQLLTYAAGLHAVSIVWVAPAFTDQHRAALDWLNEITDETFKFFGLEVELWKIGDSAVAPKFNIVSKPNEWSRSVNQAAKQIASEALTETKKSQLEYWVSFREYLISGNSRVRPQKSYPQHWANYKIGRSGFVLHTLLNSRENRIAVGLVMNDEKAKSYYGLLFEQREEIEEELGFQLEWLPLPEKKSARMLVSLNDKDPLNKEAWPEYHVWMKEKLELFNTVFSPRIRNLDADEWETDELP